MMIKNGYMGFGLLGFMVLVNKVMIRILPVIMVEQAAQLLALTSKSAKVL